MQKNLWNKYSDYFGNTILHPTFFAKRNEFLAIKLAIQESENKTVFDIGCGRQQYKKLFLKENAKYIAVDKKSTHKKFYQSKLKPDLFADLENLNIKKNSADIVLLISVIEDTENPFKAINEVSKILKNTGKIFLVTAFTYPIHDAPYDYFRLTKYYIKRLSKQNQLKIIYELSPGNEFSSIICLFNTLIFYKIKNLNSLIKFLLITLFLPVSILLNIIGVLLEYIYLPKDNKLPIHNITILQKN